jgi:hypothetical protein
MARYRGIDTSRGTGHRYRLGRIHPMAQALELATGTDTDPSTGRDTVTDMSIPLASAQALALARALAPTLAQAKRCK